MSLTHRQTGSRSSDFVSYATRDVCRLCAAPLPYKPSLDLDWSPLANELTDSPNAIQDAFPLALYQCAACHHVQLRTVIPPERLYPADYPYSSGTSPVFRRHLHRLADHLTDQFTGWPSLVIDIGSNDGTLLDAIHHQTRKRTRILGIDPARKLAIRASAADIPTLPLFFTAKVAREIRAAYGPADLVTCLNCFAHVGDLNDFTEGVAELLGDDGTFVFEVAYLPALIETNAFPSIYFEHIDHHHLRPLVPFFERHGMRLHRAERVDSQGGSIRCYVSKGAVTTDCATASKLADLIAAEERIDLAAFAANTQRIGVELNALLRGIKAEGKTIAIYGAPARLTTLSYVAGIDRSLVDFVVDDTPEKISKFTPGKHIPILPVSTLYERRPDYVLIAAWTYEADIRARHAGFEGKWLIPLPEPRVV